MLPLSPLTHEVRGDPIIYCAILCVTLNPQSGDFSGAILEVPFKALLHLIKRTFPDSEFLSRECSNDYFFGRSLVLPWFLLGF